MRRQLRRWDRLFLIFDYLGPLCLLSSGRKHNRFMRFHFDQGIAFFSVELFLFIISDIVLNMLGVVEHYMFAGMVFILLLPINITAITLSIRGRYFRIPVIGWERSEVENYLGIEREKTG